MIRAIPVLIGLALSTAALAQQAPAPAVAASPQAAAAATKPAAPQRDLTDPRMRDTPVRCRPGEVDAARGRTLAQIFGADWPAAPTATRRAPAQAVNLGRVEWPAASGQASATTAVLVDAAGRPLRATALCASTPALVPLVEAAAMQGTYRAATFDGTPATGVTLVTWRVGAPRRER